MRSRLSLLGPLLVGLLLVPVGVAECGEVVVLESGAEKRRTRIWIVDVDGVAYIRGNANGSWVARVRDHAKVRLRRAGEWRSHRAIPVATDATRVHRAMRSKYGFSERLREALRGVESSAVFRLEPFDPPTSGARGVKR